MQWIAVGYAGLSSLVVLCVSYYTQMKEIVQGGKYLVIVFVLAVQAALVLVAKLYFFSEIET